LFTNAKDNRISGQKRYHYDGLTGLIFKKNAKDLAISSHIMYSSVKEIQGFKLLIEEYQKALGYSNLKNFEENKQI